MALCHGGQESESGVATNLVISLWWMRRNGVVTNLGCGCGCENGVVTNLRYPIVEVDAEERRSSIDVNVCCRHRDV
jgi:hypothetical protein